MRANLLILASATIFAVSAAAEDEVSTAVDRALPYLEDQGTWWMEKKKCASCHHTTYFIWAKDLALQAGHDIDADVLDGQRKWLWEALLKEREPNPKKPDDVKPGELIGERNIEGVCQLLVSPAASEVPEEPLKKLQEIVLRNQTEKGNWKPGGQLPNQKRPGEETQFVTNQWGLLAVGKQLEAAPETGENAIPPARTTEWFAMNALLHPDKEDVLTALTSRQNEDGGWSWQDGEPSCPMATGQALLALGRSGTVKRQQESVRRAREFLTKAQDREGYWETLSTKDRDETTDVSNFWGTAWAVIGLLESR